ncbi:uncharacterized protein V6R79_006254 [Siganus canaliculatus]
MALLDQIAARRLSRGSSPRWNFNSRIVSTVYENLDDLIECFETIRSDSTFDSTTLFHQIMPHVDMMYQQLQKRDTDMVFVKRALQNFTSSVQAIRDQSFSQQQQQQQQEAPGTTKSRRALGEQENQRLLKEVSAFITDQWCRHTQVLDPSEKTHKTLLLEIDSVMDGSLFYSPIILTQG